MPKPLLCNLWVDAACQKLRRVAVPKIMEADLWQVGTSNEPDKLVDEAIRLQWVSVSLGDDVPPIAIPFKDLKLKRLYLPPAKRPDKRAEAAYLAAWYQIEQQAAA